MSPKLFNPIKLTPNQRTQLVDIVSQTEPTLLFDKFSDRVLMLLEDIPGFESLSDSESQSIINQLWSLYHGQRK